MKKLLNAVNDFHKACHDKWPALTTCVTFPIGIALMSTPAMIWNYFFPIDPSLYEVRPDPFRDAPIHVQDIDIVNKALDDWIAVYDEDRNLCFLANPPQRNGYVLGDETNLMSVPCTDGHIDEAKNNVKQLKHYGLR
jgi:hypothetical protein